MRKALHWSILFITVFVVLCLYGYFHLPSIRWSMHTRRKIDAPLSLHNGSALYDLASRNLQLFLQKDFSYLELIEGVAPRLLFRRSTLGETFSKRSGSQTPRKNETKGKTKWVIGGRKRSAVPSIACLFSGFLHQYELALDSCPQSLDGRSKGSERCPGRIKERILEPLQCDVYLSIWDRRSPVDQSSHKATETYINQLVDPADIVQAYGEQLASAHVQHYEQYSAHFVEIQKQPRTFTQTLPSGFDNLTAPAAWKDAQKVVNQKNFLRYGDYMQVYKQWCVVQLASVMPYDFFFLIKADVLPVFILSDWMWVPDAAEKKAKDFSIRNGTGTDQNIPTMAVSAKKRSLRTKVRIAKASFQAHQISFFAPRAERHIVKSGRVHVHAFDTTAFSLLGTVADVTTVVESLFDQIRSKPLSGILPKFRAETELADGVFATLNLMFWNVIFSSHFKLDTGPGYFVPSDEKNS